MDKGPILPLWVWYFEISVYFNTNSIAQPGLATFRVPCDWEAILGSTDPDGQSFTL